MSRMPLPWRCATTTARESPLEMLPPVRAVAPLDILLS